MPDIFDEVEEDLRAERAQSFLRRFGGLIIAGIIAILAGTGVFVWWSEQREAAADATADQFLGAAQLADKSDTALAGVDRAVAGQAAATFAKLAADSAGGYRVLSRLRLAALQWQLGEHKEAVATWQSVSAEAGAPQLLRDLATVVSAQHQIDTADPVTLKQTVEGLTAADNPWRPMAQQIVAMIDLRQGKTKEAAELLKRIAGDPNAPEGVRQMVGSLLSALPQPGTAPNSSVPPALPGAPTTTPAAAGGNAPVAPGAQTGPGVPAPTAANPVSPQPAAPPSSTHHHKTGTHKPAPNG